MITSTHLTRIQHRLSERVARTAWLLFATINVLTTIATIPARYRAGLAVCVTQACEDNFTTLSASSTLLLEAWHISLPTYAAFTTGLSLLSSLVFWGVGMLIFTRASGRIAYLLSLALILAGSWMSGGELVEGNPFWTLLSSTQNYLLFVCLILGFYLFPNGRFVPQWTRWLALALFVTEFFYSYFPDAPFSPHNFFPPLEFTIWIGALVMVPLSQLYRFLRVSGPVERQQTKWVVGGLLTTLLGILTLVMMNFILPPDLKPVTRLIAWPVITISLLAIPITLAIAIVRYRLWDIDIIIRRTLIYAALTGSLVLVYLGSIVSLQQFFRTLTGQESQFAIVVSTLAIAALFNPLRHRIQGFIDRRFYRRKYDAQQALALFAIAARDEVELQQLTGQLLHVIGETVQPTHVSLWLRDADPAMSYQV